MLFQQEDFEYKDLFTENSYLADVLSYYVQEKHLDMISQDLAHFSKKACSNILQDMWLAEKNLPHLKSYSHWGERIDEIVMDEAWSRMHAVSAVEGLVAIGYERKSAEDSRIHQFLKLLIFHPSSAFYTCPLAMTDGACRVLELENSDFTNKIAAHLKSRNPNQFWTAGQWMTEKAGGSDVSESETFAELKEDRYYLTGTKWFTSAITAQIAMTLAQTQINGENKLSLFLVKIRDENKKLNQIEVLRLKDKLGTRAMPTAELKLKETPADLIGELGGGIKKITTILNISRLYNSVCATGTMYRLHSLSRDYSIKRKAFGKKLIDHPLQQLSLVKMQSITNASVHFCVKLAQLLGKSELNSINETEDNLLRVMTPVLKLWSAKNSMAVVSELIESFGGAGYIEDTELPRFLRDAQVFPIWEGTTNILSLDVIRAITKNKTAVTLFEYIEAMISENELSFKNEKLKIIKAIGICKDWLIKNINKPTDLQFGARDFSFAIGDIFAANLLINFADKTRKNRDIQLAEVFINQINLTNIENQKGSTGDFKATLLSN
jgi:putative acyl-CoA dehydrogenase